jgi:DNA-binding transcriptional LysR family regulator
VQLVERDGRRLRLTLAGQDLAHRAAAAVHGVDEVSRLADAQRAGTSGVVRILSSATPADYLLPLVIADFLREAPSASVLLRQATAAEETIEAYDLRIGPPEPVPPGWRADLLYVDELVFFVSARHPLVGMPDVGWADLQERTLVGQFLDQYWARYWVGRPDPPPLPRSAVDVTSTESVMRVVEAVDGVGMAVRSALAPGLASGQFVALPLLEEPVELPYVLTYRSGVRLLPVVERFRRILLDHVANP